MNATVNSSAPLKKTAQIEDIILRHSGRGMTVLQKYLPEDYCHRAARRLLDLPRGNILLTTGFYVAGAPETDGPPGTVCAALVLRALGFHPVIVTDRHCTGLFEPESIDVEYVSLDAGSDTYLEILDRYQPAALISIERCGRNLENDYANMRGVSIADQTAAIDLMFELASDRGILTVGIGDGGNEIGMGNLKEIISEKLSLNPCTVCVDELIVATTSNWGAFGLAACLDILSGCRVFPSCRQIAGYLESSVARGCVDGVNKTPTVSVDGFSPQTEQEIVEALAEAIAGEIK